MTDKQNKRLVQLEAKESRRKEQVKEYFIRRRAKEQYYKVFFEKNANDADRKKLADMISGL